MPYGPELLRILRTDILEWLYYSEQPTIRRKVIYRYCGQYEVFSMSWPMMPLNFSYHMTNKISVMERADLVWSICVVDESSEKLHITFKSRTWRRKGQNISYQRNVDDSHTSYNLPRLVWIPVRLMQITGSIGGSPEAMNSKLIAQKTWWQDLIVYNPQILKYATLI